MPNAIRAMKVTELVRKQLKVVILSIAPKVTRIGILVSCLNIPTCIVLFLLTEINSFNFTFVIEKCTKRADCPNNFTCLRYPKDGSTNPKLANRCGAVYN